MGDRVFHHIDGNPRNDSPENIISVTRSEHGKIHRHNEDYFRKQFARSLAKKIREKLEMKE